MKNNHAKLDLMRFVKPVLWVYVLTVIINIVFVGLDMLNPLITKNIVDEVIVGKDFSRLDFFLFALLFMGIARCILGYFREFTCDWAGTKIGCNVRKDLFQKLQTLSANFYDKNNSGELISRVTDDVGIVWGLFTYIGMLLCEIAVHVTFITFCMFRLNWKLAIIPTVSMLICGLIALTMEKKLGPMYEKSGEENQLINNTAQENLNGVRTVKAFVRQAYEKRKFLVHNEKYFELNYGISKVFVRFHPILQAFRYLIPLVVLGLGGWMTINEEITIGELTAFISYSYNFVWPMEMLGWLTSGLSQAKAGIRRINKIYAEVPQVEDSGLPRPDGLAVTEQPNCHCEEVVSLRTNDEAIHHRLKGDITYEHVSFTKESGKEVLKDISFELKAGQTLGIMGSTGSGKTCLINLLTRMYDVTGGAIKIDGKDVRELPLSDLRKNVAVIMQDVFLFSETINENVKLGAKKTLSDESVHKAMIDSASYEFVSKMEDKEETVIGERGVGLSGGQKQRLTMARAMSRNAPIIIFDDSTSALDAETEKQIQKTMNEMHGMTKIIVAHRISSVKNADKILVLEKGEIAESGTHDELLAKNGLYAETYRTQYGG